jgi:acetyltransferase-like isoleucine patch superfamily enzyme
MIKLKNRLHKISYYYIWLLLSSFCRKLPRISLNSKLKNVKINSYSRIFPKVKLSNVKVGKYTYIGDNSWISNSSIGNYTSISTGVRIGMGMHPTDEFSTSPVFYSKNNPFVKGVSNLKFQFSQKKEISIGNDVWIGLNAIILDGLSIGDGSIIAANSVVTKNVEPFTIVGGVPAKTIGNRTNAQEFQSAKDWYNFNHNEL